MRTNEPIQDRPVEIVQWVKESDVDDYTSQGWQCWRLKGLHGARKGAQMRTFIAVIKL